jgi:hypothetical protein
MTKVYVIHVKGIAPDNLYSIYGIYTNVDVAYDREAELSRMKNNAETWIEVVTHDE